MKNNIIKYMACAAMALGLAATVQAAQITGGISLSGGPLTVSGPLGNDLATGTAITGWGPVTVTSVAGSYNVVGILGTSVATFAGSLQFLPTLLPSSAVIWQFGYGGVMYNFDLTAIQSVTQGTAANGTESLLIDGSGTLHIDNFTDTAGSWVLSANSASSTFSFSSSNGANVPDGGTTALLLGAALSGLGLIRRKLA